MRKIVTTHVYPPIPDRRWDWCAYYDGEEETGNVGWGQMSDILEPWTNYSWTYTERDHVVYENELWLDGILERVRWPIEDDGYEAALDSIAADRSAA